MTSNRLKNKELTVPNYSAEKQTNPMNYVFVILPKAIT
jgi:hypothetical protein